LSPTTGATIKARAMCMYTSAIYTNVLNRVHTHTLSLLAKDRSRTTRNAQIYIVRFMLHRIHIMRNDFTRL
jgi:hypothetical protein